MFTRRNEEELAEIKAITTELGQNFKEVLTRLERIEAAHGLTGGARSGGKGGGKAKSSRAKAKRGDRPKAGAKKGRSRQPAVAVVSTAGKSGKRTTAPSASSEADNGGAGAGARKRNQGAARKRDPGAEPKPDQPEAGAGAEE